MVPLREVRNRSQMTGDPQIDLSRTSFNPMLLLTDNDWRFVEETTGLTVAQKNEEPVVQGEVVGMAAKVAYTIMERRLVEFAKGPTDLRSIQRPRRIAPILETDIIFGEGVGQGGSQEVNYGGQFRIVQANKWYDGPELSFSSSKPISTASYRISLPAEVDTSLWVQILRPSTLSACLLIDTLDGILSNFSKLPAAGNWKFRFLIPGVGVPNIPVELHQLSFNLMET